jgi:RNA polymerase sigma-70 factor, ECF subfamily
VKPVKLAKLAQSPQNCVNLQPILPILYYADAIRHLFPPFSHCEMSMAQMSGDQPISKLLAAAAKGDENAWRILVDSYSKRVFGLLVRQCGDRELAEEITQATFVKIVVSLENYREEGKFEPWLFRIAMNRLRDEMRRRARHARPMDMSPSSASPGSTSGSGGSGSGTSQWQAVQNKIIHTAGTEGSDRENPLERVSRAEQVERLKTTIATMSDADQKILHLRHTAGLSFADIAETLEQPLGTVLARGNRALNKLKKLMDEPD